MKDALLRAMGAALDGLEVGLCAFDEQDRTLRWNAAFLDIFPEHLAHIYVGEPYIDNLRRFYRSRLGPAELPCVDRFVAEALERYRAQRRPYAFDHRGCSLRVSSVSVPGWGRIRLWKKVDGCATRPGGGAPGFPGGAGPGSTSVLEHLADGVLVVDVADRMVWANQAFLNLYGLASAEQALGWTMEDLVRHVWKEAPDDGALADCLRMMADQRRFPGSPFELKLPHEQFVRVIEQRGAADGWGYFIHADITHLKRQQVALARTEARYRLLAEYSQDIILYVVDGVVTYASPALTAFLGWEATEVVGQPVSRFCHPEDTARVAARLRALGAVQEADYRARAMHRDGTHVWIEARAKRLPDDERGGPLRLVINARGINARKAVEDELERAKQRLQELVMTDSLTGLANRRKLDEALEREFRRSQREGNPLALLVLDIDHFKHLNDAHGHQAGDAVLRRMASILTTFPQRAGDLAARLGGEEFVLLLPGANHHQAQAMAERVRETVQATVFDPPVNVSVTVSIGVASVETLAADSPEGLVSLADGALYAAKRAGRNRVVAA